MPKKVAPKKKPAKPELSPAERIAVELLGWKRIPIPRNWRTKAYGVPGDRWYELDDEMGSRICFRDGVLTANHFNVFPDLKVLDNVRQVEKKLMFQLSGHPNICFFWYPRNLANLYYSEKNKKAGASTIAQFGHLESVWWEACLMANVEQRITAILQTLDERNAQLKIRRKR